MHEEWETGDEDLDPRERAVRHFEAEIDEAQSAGDPRREARAHAGLGLIYADQGKLDYATTQFRECLLAARSGGDREGIAGSLFQLGRMHGQSGSMDDGLRFLSESIWEWDAVGHSSGLIQAELLAAQFEAEMGRLAEALTLLRRALDRAREGDEHEAQWRALRAMAEIRAQQGEWAECAENHRASIPILSAMSNTREEANAWLHLAAALFECRRTEEGLDAAERSRGLFALCEDVRSESNVLMTCASALATTGRISEGLERFGSAVKLLEGTGDEAGLARMYLWAAEVYGDLGQWMPALHHAEKASGCYARMGNRAQQCRALKVMAAVHEGRGFPEDAARCYEQAAELYALSGMRHNEAEVRAQLGAALISSNRLEPGFEQCERAAHALRCLGDTRQLARVLYSLGAAYHQAGNLVAAERCHSEYLQRATDMEDAAGRDRALEALAQVTADQDRLDDARGFVNRRMELAKAQANVRAELSCLWALADLARRANRPADLHACARRIGEVAESAGLASAALEADEARIGALLMMRMLPEAAEAIEEWLPKAEQTPGAALDHWRITLGLTKERLGDYAAAARIWRALIPRFRDQGVREPMAVALRSLANCELEMGRNDAALEAAREHYELVEATSERSALRDSMLLLARCYRARGRRLLAWRLVWKASRVARRGAPSPQGLDEGTAEATEPHHGERHRTAR